jgi:hypothetical protein
MPRFAELRLGAWRLLPDPFQIGGNPGVLAETDDRREAQGDEIIIGIQGMNLPVASLAQKCGREQGSAFFPGNQMMDSGCNRRSAAQLTQVQGLSLHPATV